MIVRRWRGCQAPPEASQAHPGPAVHTLSALMQLSPQAFPLRHVLQHSAAAAQDTKGACPTSPASKARARRRAIRISIVAKDSQLVVEYCMMQIRMRLIKAALVGALLTSPQPTEASTCKRGPIAGVVTYVRDGDTIVVGTMPVRLNGVAAPEADEPGGEAATAAMVALVDGRTVRCELDGSRTHDRCAGICYLDGEDIAEALVSKGLARDCPRFSGGRYAVVEAQAAAKGATIRRDHRLPGYCRPR